MCTEEPNRRTFSLRLPHDDRFIGRSCSGHDCGRYFKIHVDCFNDRLWCPYCGESFHKNDLITKEQRDHVIESMKQQLRSEALGMLGRSTKPKEVIPKYEEHAVDSSMNCACGMKFQVLGVFGYCPGCRAETLSLYDANWDIITREISASADVFRTLRHAYNDLVSTFETICSDKAAKVTDESINFQSLFDTRKFFKKHASVDILDAVDKTMLLAMRRAFQKRHVCIHAKCVIGDRYVRLIPEDEHLHGQRVKLSMDELTHAYNGLRIAIQALVEAVDDSP